MLIQNPPKKRIVKLQGSLLCDLSGYKDKGWREKQAWGAVPGLLDFRDQSHLL